MPAFRNNAVIDASTMKIFYLSIICFKGFWCNVPCGTRDSVPGAIASFKRYIYSPIEADDFNPIVAGDRKQSLPIGCVVGVAWLLVELNVQQQQVLLMFVDFTNEVKRIGANDSQ